MDWVQAFTIVGILGGYSFWMFNRLDADIKAVSEELKTSNRHNAAMFAEQNKRTDKLYEMAAQASKDSRDALFEIMKGRK